jgi:uncharacterized protein (DUF1810 family)
MAMIDDEYRLHRFVTAQAPVYDEALAMLRHGVMCTPHMDFIFPRLTSVYVEAGSSGFGVGSLDEARAILEFPILGGRYRECLETLSWLADISPIVLFGDADVRRLHASLTLFAEATGEPVVRSMLTIWFGDLADGPTMDALSRSG